MSNFYRATAKGYDELHGEEQKEKVRLIKENIRIKKTYLLLDVGCATGISMDFPCTVIGIDPEIALLRLNPHKNLILARAECLPFGDSSFDIVISVTSLHNFNDIEKGLLEMKRVGKHLFVFSLLKKSPHCKLMQQLIHGHFQINKTVDSRHDLILICK